MGITPIKDAAGLQDMLIPQVSFGKQSDNSGSDFKTVWNNQAKETGADGSNLVNSLNKDSVRSDDFSKASGKKAEKSDIASDDRRMTDRSDSSGNASKTDVKGKGSPDKTPENVNDRSGGMLKDEEIVSASDVISDQMTALMNSLAEMLDISTDELKEMLAAEGIEGFDILDRDIFSGFMIKALGADSQLSLLTNEEDYADYSAGMDLFDAVMYQEAENFGMKISELLDAVKEKTQAGENTADVARTQVSADDEALILPDAKAVSEESDEPVTRFIRNSDGQLEQVDIDSAGKVSDAKTVMNPQETGKQKQDHEGRHEDKGSQLLSPAVSSNLSEVKAEVPVEEARPVFSTNAQEIAEQIMDRMKTVTNGDFSDVEMQLHPASLGNLHIRVTNNAGVITAQFVTENEAVKSAVESQMMRLSDQLEAQGVRVEAVEVTIAPKGFDAGSGSGGNETRDEKKNARTRKITLGEDGMPDASDLEEEDLITAEMMAANGNTVDFMA